MSSKSPFTSVWSRRPSPKNTREQPVLSRAQIVHAAMELLDAEGLDALSMRKLGARLGSGATSIYWYVTNKEELLELVLDEVYGELSVPDPAETGWRDAAAVFAYGLRQAMVTHPWSITLIGTLPSLGPNAMAASDRLMKAFEIAGFTGIALDYAAAAVISYTLGATTPEVSWLNLLSRSGVNADEWVKAMRPQVDVAAADYPGLRAHYAGYANLDPAATMHISFDFGLVALLDGLEARLRQP
ncbi:TetR/AcrR family transcriptional regulator [Sphaerisporangium corydalis]|uniref:TetR/AcrR family transcriptional regulator n=1 Tax=Sphaerisporangium corydalis TaxID=1441875 RepID=A0ABV9E4Y8_9ACTN|nr:TetR/AcrR family transcriptional regulator [Sphaerisporangium corydalis]